MILFFIFYDQTSRSSLIADGILRRRSAAAGGGAALPRRRRPVFRGGGGVSSLKVPWRRDPLLDATIERDKKWRLCSRVVREVLNEPGSAIALRYLEKRRERLRLPVKVKTFLSRNPLLFDVYQDRLRPAAEPVPFLRPSTRLTKFLREEERVRSTNEGLVVAKLCKLLMMSKHKVLSSEKLLHVKRDFGFPDDFLSSLVPRYPHRLRFAGGAAASFSAAERRAAEETRLTGVPMRANFELRFPRGFSLRKEMREWTRDWLELPYVSPYADVGELRPASPEMEKRMVGLLHEFLSLTVLRRAAVPTVGKFAEEFSLSNAFPNAFTRHPGIFYLSLKGGVETAVLREAYGGEGELLDRDPLLEIKDMFEELLEEGHRQWVEQQRTNRQSAGGSRDRELLASGGQSQ
ncbi:unnamed protein product [Spirodela intermedia]|uniref:PORR domain-containing protein n=1 Tax=Spirodela intermedia TaxID=51605 RepID=A0A7I8I8W2_SPIIN|nr:unnamed protein product [Spirodela intermedia]CAA6653924.1 unnamed protein product [Spirodela intermedia]